MLEDSKPIVAYLTLGNGEVSKACCETLFAEEVLAGVVFSRRNKKVSRVKQIKDYGVWYIAQQLIFQIGNKLFHRNVTADQLDKIGVDSIEWNEVSDEEKIIQWLAARNVTVILVCGFQFILSESFLNRFKYCANLHPSLLPKYRGPDPMMWGLLERQTQFGITLHRIDAEVDTGNIISQTSVPAPPLPYVGLVELSLGSKVGALIGAFITALTENTLSETRQTEGEYLPTPTLYNRRQRRRGLL